MNVESFELLVRTEKSAKRFFIRRCRKNSHIFCTRCGSRKAYRIRRGRYRCSQCRYEFGDFTGRWIGKLNISSKNWLWIIKLFELEVSARKASLQMRISYPTVLKAFPIIRMAITAPSTDGDLLLQGEIEADETYFGGRRKGKRGRAAFGKIPVFGILERKGGVKVEVLRNVTAEEILNHTIKAVRRGSIVYTDRFRSYDSLMFCGYRHLRINHGKRFARGKVYINGLEGFWSYAKERIIKFHGVSKEKFPFYLKEMEFRYNNRKHSLFIMLAQYLCNLVAKPL
jgi:transposase